jgi:hypothetical protein
VKCCHGYAEKHILKSNRKENIYPQKFKKTGRQCSPKEAEIN